jgi:hypothetical protein
MEVEGATASGAGVLEEGADNPGTVVVEADGGIIRDMRLGVYSFAFLKNSIISTKGIAYEKPTFSQFTSLPCDWAREITPSTPHFTEMCFIAQTGSSMVLKDATSFRRLSAGISSFFFGQNPTNMRIKTWEFAGGYPEQASYLIPAHLLSPAGGL